MKTAVLTPKIKKIQCAISKLEDEVDELQKKLNSELLALAFSTWGVKEGGCVRCDRDGKIYKVTLVETRWMRDRGDVPWLRGVAQRKDGSWGERISHIYGDWSVIKEIK